MNSPLVSTASTGSPLRGREGAYCAFTSTSGIGGTIGKSRRPPPPHQEPDPEEDHRRNDGDLDEAEVVMEALVARAEPIANSGEGECPHRGADQGQDRVAPERHPEDPGGDRDEGPDHRRDPSDQDRELVPAVEPALRPAE